MTACRASSACPLAEAASAVDAAAGYTIPGPAGNNAVVHVRKAFEVKNMLGDDHLWES